ncbi:hypothetical protein [Roseofilum casamattae]|uniref:DUF2993 domain-containing protein n=1 Tax=Roseofilum casamattae BLCC-M143 TaxID=3022442 RepID=A0ABT7BY96_9CYAN|nr:hypothetical protein [Roseofilum casamattae]MDJ1184169.1 hypothetical protein [Roseofilum casamattae BLCC-M143]
MKRVIRIAAILGFAIAVVRMFPLSVSALSRGELPVLAQAQLSADRMNIALRKTAKIFLVDGSQKSGIIDRIDRQSFTLTRNSYQEIILWDKVAAIEFNGKAILRGKVGDISIRGDGGPKMRLRNVPLQALQDSPEGNLAINLRVIPEITDDDIVEVHKAMNNFQYVVDKIEYDRDRDRLAVELTGYEKLEE